MQFQGCGRAHLVPATMRRLKSTPFSEEKNKLREVKRCDEGHTDNACHAILEPRPAILASVLLTTLSCLFQGGGGRSSDSLKTKIPFVS